VENGEAFSTRYAQATSLNSHFADYRVRYKRGGDFRVFSDLLREPLPPGTPAITLPKR